MIWFKRWWLRWRYQHPSIGFERLTAPERLEAIQYARQMFSKSEGDSPSKKGKPPFRPTLHQIAFTQLSVAMNASALTAEARWLRLRGYHSRAFVLAKLAQEEFGKIYLLDHAALMRVTDAGDSSWRGFWKDWRDHKAKSLHMKMPFAPHGLSTERLDYEEETKLNALYVEFGENFISVPLLAVTKEMAEQMIEICDMSEIHAWAKLRDLPLIDDDNNPGTGVEGLLAALFRTKDPAV